MAGLTELTAKLKERTGLYKEIFTNAASIEDAVANAAKAGYSVTSAELAQAVVEVRGPEVLQLSDADLEQVAGGNSPLENQGVQAYCTCYGA
jgi:hypothetical protein